MKKLALLILLLGLNACSYSSQKQEISRTLKTATQTEEAQNTPVPESEKLETVNIVKFFDYNCHHCRDAHFTVKNLQTQFGDKINVEFKHFPLSPQTYLVAETAECARRQGEDKFLAYHDALLENNFGQYDPANLQTVAESVGIDLEAFNTCAANGAGKSEVQTDVDEATALGVKGTPYFLLNDSIPVPGAIPEKSLARLIQQILDGEVR